MRSIMTTYPDFMALPRGIKKLLLASENYFFDEAKAPSRASASLEFSTGRDRLRNQTRNQTPASGVRFGADELNAASV